MKTPTRGPALAAGRRLREDLRLALAHLIFSTIGGAVWMPRIGRRLIYHAAGASMQSGPGAHFVFAGQPCNLTVGRGTYTNTGVFVEAIAPVRIGDDCALGMEVMILTSHHPISQDSSWDPVAHGRPVTIGDRVWIGARALLLPGASVESDVVIAAGAVVSGHCRSGGVHAGVPARRVRSFDDADGA
jgi:maltose O-acetyltransferase